MLVDLIIYNKIVPAVNQTETHLYCQRRAEHVWENKYGVAHQAYSPLGQGKADEMFREKSVCDIAAKYGKTPAQILLHYLIQNNVSAIPKSSRPERIAENIDVFDFELNDKEMSALEALDRKIPLIGTPESPELVEKASKW